MQHNLASGFYYNVNDNDLHIWIVFETLKYSIFSPDSALQNTREAYEITTLSVHLQ
jgi:hypothetical protein